MLFLPLAIIAFAMLLFISRAVARKADASLNIVFAATGDDDIKIAGNVFSRADSEDDAAAAARQFLLEKDSGNIQKARDLGVIYAKTILEAGSGVSPFLPKGRSELESHHQILLCSYAVNRVIAERSPNSIIAQTSLNVFYSEVESADPALYLHISDMAAFSLYILNDREGGSEEEMGKIYARLCGLEGERDVIEEGGRVYRRFYDYCAGEMEKAGYADVWER